jgi:hypothetical protein
MNAKKFFAEKAHLVQRPVDSHFTMNYPKDVVRLGTFGENFFVLFRDRNENGFKLTIVAPQSRLELQAFPETKMRDSGILCGVEANFDLKRIAVCHFSEYPEKNNFALIIRFLRSNQTIPLSF